METQENKPLKNVVFVSHILLWVTAISCLCITAYFSMYKNNIFNPILNTLTNNNNPNDIEHLMLKSGEVVFENKKSFVINTFRYQGVEEKLPYEINIRKEPQKLYDYIFQKKNNLTKPKLVVEDFTIKPLPR